MKAFLKTTKGKIILGAAALLIVLLIILLITKVIGGEEGYRSISVSEISGSVMTENGGKKYEAYKNMRLADGYALTTDIASYTRMVLDGDKYVKLEEKSRALFEALGSDKQRKTAIRLEDGTLTTEITAPLGEDEDYIVNTPNAVLAVRGTFFKAVVRYDTNGDAYTDVYTYGGTVMCKRVMPDGTVVEEEVMITAGYKARVKMDEIITVYVEELIEEGEDYVDPIDIKEVPDGDIVDIYNASAHGHKMFAETSELWREITERGIDLNDYHSVYDGGEIPSYDKDSGAAETERQTEAVTEAVPEAETNAPETSGGVTDIPEENSYNYDDTEEYYPAETTAVPNTETNSAFTEKDSGTGASSESRAESHTYTEVTEHTHTPYTDVFEDEPAVTEVTSVTAAETTSAETTYYTETEPTAYTTTTAPAERPSASGTTVSEAVTVPNVTTKPEVTAKPEVTTTSEVTTTPEVTSKPEVTTKPDVTTTPEVHVHNFEEYISDGNATCTEDGTKTAVCSCGEKDTVTDVGSAGHKEIRDVTEATAVSEGRIYIYCRVCGEVIANEVIPRLPIYIDDGNLIISETGYSQGGGEEIPYTGDYNISQRSSTPAASSITVISGTHNINFNGINTSTAFDAFTVEKDAAVTISGGSKENKFSAAGGNCYGLYNNNGSVTIKSGIFNFSGIRGIFGAADSVFSISGGYISANGSSDGIRNSGTFSVSGGNLSAYGGDNGIWNNGNFTAVGGSLSAEGGGRDIKVWSDARITGGSVRAVNNNIDGKFVNGIGDELECEVFDVFPGETVRTFENSAGDKYVYGLAPEDKASDGYYYVWKPKDFTPEFDGTVYMDDGSVTITADGITQGGKSFPWTEDITISQKDRSTAFDVKIAIESGTHNITFDGVNINSSKGNCVEISSGASAFVSGSVKENIIASARERAVNNSGSLRIDSGAFKLSGGYCGIYNFSQAAVNGGRISVSGGVCDIFVEESGTLTVSGGSVKSENSAIGGKITNASGDELECKVYGEYTGNLTFTDSDGNEYTYALNVGDSIDGGYYVWQPKAVPTGVEVSEENFPDEVFRNYVSTNFDKDSDGYLSDSEIEAVTEVYVFGTSSVDGGVASLKGIEHFNKLKILVCMYNSGLTELDVSQNMALTHLYCLDTQITNLDVNNNTALMYLACSNANITGIDVSNNTVLKSLACSNTQITNLDVKGNTALEFLNCSNTDITSLDLSNNTDLTELNCQKTKISHLDFTNTSIDTFNATGCEHYITVVNGKFDTKTIDGFDINRVSELNGASKGENGIISGIKEGTKITYWYDCGRGFSEEFTLVPDENSTFDTEIPEGVEVNEENFPDTVFRNCVSIYFDKDKNGYISDEEIAVTTEFYVDGALPANNGGVYSLQGVEYLMSLETFFCYNNSKLTELDVSKNTALTYLDCRSTSITNLDISKNTALTTLYCDSTMITSLNLSNNTALTMLTCSDTNIPYVDLTNTSVTYFSATNCTYAIPSGLSFDVTTDFNFSSFNPNNVSNVQGAEFSKENGIFYNFTSDTITYTYDCGRGFTETFTLVRTGDIMSYALEDDEDSIEDEDIPTDDPEQDIADEDIITDDTEQDYGSEDIPADDPEQDIGDNDIITDVPEQIGGEDIPPENTEQDNGDENISEDVPEQEVIGEDIPADEPEQSIPDMLLDAVVTSAVSAVANMVDITIFVLDIVIYLISILIKLWR